MQGNISLDGKNCFSCPKIQGQNPRHLFIDTYIDTFISQHSTYFFPYWENHAKSEFFSTFHIENISMSTNPSANFILSNYELDK